MSAPSECGLPRRYRRRADGAIEHQTEDQNDESWVWICSDIAVVGETRDQAGENWAVVLRATDRAGEEKSFPVPRSSFAGHPDEVIRDLLARGLEVTTHRGRQRALVDLLQQWHPDRLLRSTSRLGWVSESCEAFIAGPNRVIGDQSYVYNPEVAPPLAEAMRAKGDLALWKHSVAFFAVGNPILIFALSQAFSGPLLEMAGLEGGGFNLRGASSRGKSSVLRAGASVWGAPGFVTTWRATDNALEWLCAAANGSLLLLDELGQLDGRKAGEVAYMIANGQAKARANAAGGARRRLTWRTTFLSSGEISLGDKIAESGARVRAGQEVRVLDIPATERAYGCFDDLQGEETGAGFAEMLKTAAAECFGLAGPIFVERLLADPDLAQARIRLHLADFRESAQERFAISAPDGQISRAIDRFALVAAAGEMAAEWELTGWAYFVAFDAVLEVFGLWLGARGDLRSTEALQAISQLREFISRHGPSRFQPLDDQKRPDEDWAGQNRAGFRDEQFFYVLPEVWRREVLKGLDPRRATRDLVEAGYVISADGRNHQTRLPFEIKGDRPRAYKVGAHILNGDPEPGEPDFAEILSDRSDASDSVDL